jgi:hypothetical protein
MKTRQVILILMVFLLCGIPRFVTAQAQVSSELLEYRIKKVRSIRSHYVIYAERGGFVYKIVSEKTNTLDGCETIRKGKSYYLSLRPDLMGPNMVSRVDCRIYKNNVKICLEKGCLPNLFAAINLKGRCLVLD